MQRLLAFLGALALAAAAQAQLYKWVDQNGKVQYGDNPPPGAKVTKLKAPAGAAPPPATAAAKDAKGAKKGPLTPAEQEQEYRKRQAEAAKASQKDEQARKDADTRSDNCARAQESLRGLESGQRIARTDEKGERYYIDDETRARETDKARDLAKQWCN